MQNFSHRPRRTHHNGRTKKHALGSREGSLSEKRVSGGGEVEKQSRAKKGREKEGRRKHADVRRVQTATERVHGNEKNKRDSRCSGAPCSVLFCPVLFGVLCVLLRGPSRCGRGRRVRAFWSRAPEGARGRRLAGRMFSGERETQEISEERPFAFPWPESHQALRCALRG